MKTKHIAVIGIIGYFAVCAGVGFASGYTGGFTGTEAERAVTREIMMLENLPSVQAYHELDCYNRINHSLCVSIFPPIPNEKELFQNPEALANIKESTRRLEQLVQDPNVVRYVQLKEEREELLKSSFSTKKGIYYGIYGILAGLIPLAILSPILYYVSRNKERKMN